MTENVRGLVIDAGMGAIALKFKGIERDLETLAREGARFEQAEDVPTASLAYMDLLNQKAHSMAEQWAEVARLSHKVITLMEGRP